MNFLISLGVEDSLKQAEMRRKKLLEEKRAREAFLTLAYREIGRHMIDCTCANAHEYVLNHVISSPAYWPQCQKISVEDRLKKRILAALEEERQD